MKHKNENVRHTNLPETLEVEGRTFTLRNGIIPLHEIILSSKKYLNLVDIYQQKVLSQPSRTISLLGRKNPTTILYTLLGYEVKSSYKRIQCPDLATARYVRLFSELGCHSIQLPYDPTLTAELIPELEAAVNDLTQQMRTLFPRDASLQAYVIRRVFAIIRRTLRMSKSPLPHDENPREE